MSSLECVVLRGELVVNGRAIATPYPVRQAAVAGPVVAVLFEPDADPRGYGTFQNLIAVDAVGSPVWTASLPTNETGDCYYQIASTSPLIARSVKSYDCRIDPTTGAILESVFAK